MWPMGRGPPGRTSGCGSGSTSGRGSPPAGGWAGSTLSEENRRQLWIPPGFAHGFVVTGEHALFSYKCTNYYAPEFDGSILWNDPGIGIDWPLEGPSLSDKDLAAPGRFELRSFLGDLFYLTPREAEVVADMAARLARGSGTDHPWQ